MKYFRSVGSFIRGILPWFKKASRRTKAVVLAVVALLLLGGGFSLFAGDQNISKDDVGTLPTVSVKSAQEIASILDPLPLVGTVRSATEATVLTEASGRVTRVYRSLGQFVSQGAVIAEIENSSEYAQVLQAEANLARVQESSEDDQLESAITGFETAKEGALTAILSSYATTENAVRQSADQILRNPTSRTPEFLLLSNDSGLQRNIESTRVSIQDIIARQQASGAVLTVSSDLTKELRIATEEVKQVRAYLDLVVDALNKAIPNENYSASTINTIQTSVSAARTNVIAAVSSLSGSTETLAAKRAAKEIAENSLETSGAGTKRQDVLSAEASLAAARAQFEKKVVRAPFAGTINSLPIELGQFVSALQPAATIANNNLLEVRAYVTERDLKYLSSGLTVRSVDGITGTITSIAPALDPITKRIEVRITLSDTTDITNGQSVRLLVERINEEVSLNTPIVPLTAISFIGEDAHVFTVNEEGVLVAIPVSLGTILGDRVEVSGIEVDTKIVVDARGFADGDKVTVK